MLDAFPNDPNKWLPETNLPAQPVLVSPASPSIPDTLTPVLRVGAFADPNGDIHLMTRWQVSVSGTGLDFENDMVLDLESETSLTSLQLPDFILQENLGYYWRVKFIDQNQYESAWSDLFSFRVPENSQDPDGDGIEDEFKIPTPVDLDGNGENDNLQADIKSIATIVDDVQVGVKASTGVISVEQVKSINPEGITGAGKPENLPYGLVSFRLIVAPGADAEAVVYFSEPLAPEMKWYKYDPASGWYDFSANAVFNSARTAVTLRLTDGGAGDADGVANGIIVDPSGPGTASVSEDSISGGGGSSGGGGGCFISGANSNPIEGRTFTIGLLAISLFAFLGSVSGRNRN